jgi:hypothetical protein
VHLAPDDAVAAAEPRYLAEHLALEGFQPGKLIVLHGQPLQELSHKRAD